MMVGLFEGGKIPEWSMVRHICFVVLLASLGSGVVVAGRGSKEAEAGAKARRSTKQGKVKDKGKSGPDGAERFIRD